MSRPAFASAQTKRPIVPLVGVDSPTYNHGRFFIAPFPMATYGLGAVKLNAIYVPRYQDNRFAVFGLYFSIPLSPNALP